MVFRAVISFQFIKFVKFDANRIDCEHSLFFSKIRGKEHKTSMHANVIESIC